MERSPSRLPVPRTRLALVGQDYCTDEASLAEELQRAEPHAQRVAWDRFSPLVRGILRRSLGERDVDDLVQDVFVAFFRNVPRLENRDSLRSYLIGITVRLTKKEFRRRKVRRLLGLASSPTAIDVAAPPSIEPGTVQALYRLLDQVSGETRLLFVLRYVKQLSLAEIEVAMGWSRSTVKRKLKRASDLVFVLAKRDPFLAEYLPENYDTERDDDEQ